MITVIGLDVDSTLVRLLEQCLVREVPVQFVNLRAAVRGDWCFELPPASSAVLSFADITCTLSPDGAYYCRLTDLSSLTEAEQERRQWAALLRALDLWLSAVPGVVVNRPNAGHDNSSKPLHEATLTGLGFRVPDSITTSSLDRLLEFVARGPSISKAVCGVRADSMMVAEEDLAAFRPEQGPVHVQRYVPGADVRIHVIGETLVAQRIDSHCVDYRRQGDFDDLVRFDPPDELCEMLVRSTRELGLEFAGWDFKVDDHGQYWCLEVNPMPGYRPYDLRCDAAISMMLLGHLRAGGGR